MRVQIEQQIIESGIVVNDKILLEIEMDSVPRVGDEIYVNGAGIYKIKSIMWSVGDLCGIQSSVAHVNVGNREIDEIAGTDKTELIHNACLSIRHDYGLMGPIEREKLQGQAHQWARAFGLVE